ncbi:MAG: hypothetical protein ABIW34_07580 [Ginsengibacter sp.]
MIYKFTKPDNFFRKFLATYDGQFIELCVPQTDDEKFCYVDLTDQQYPMFAEHFAEIGISLQSDYDEYPGSSKNIIANRIERFRVIRRD